MEDGKKINDTIELWPHEVGALLRMNDCYTVVCNWGDNFCSSKIPSYMKRAFMFDHDDREKCFNLLRGPVPRHNRGD